MRLDKTEQLVEALYRAVPYPHQVEKLEFSSLDDGAVRFIWRGVKYRVSRSCDASEVGDGVLIGSDRAILLGELVRRQAIADFLVRPSASSANG